MQWATYAAFYLGVAAYAAAAAFSILYLREREYPEGLTAALRLGIAGALLFAAALGLRFAASGRVPLTTSADSLDLFVVLGTLTAAGIAYDARRRNLLAYYLPALALLALLGAWPAASDLAREPKALPGAFVVAHVVAAFLGYALFFVASLTSAAYLIQVRRLKLHQATGPFQKLPSLEHLDATLFHLIRFGYPIFVATMVLGVVWANRDHALLSTTWWYSPKIVLSVAMALFYAVCYHARSLGLLRGPKLALLVCTGFGSLMFIFLTLEMLRLTNYNFYTDVAAG